MAKEKKMKEPGTEEAKKPSAKLFAQLKKLEGAVNREYNPLEHVLRTPSPSVNWALANKGHGLPEGYSMVLWGPPKSGKSILSNAFIGQVHQDDPEAYTVTFNTEMRGELQQADSASEMFGIDPDRHITFDVNEPILIFDRIEKDLAALVDEGLKIKLVVIDSLAAILGRRQMNADTVDQAQIGDRAATLQEGLMRILGVLRRKRISLIMTTHSRAEMDRTEQMRGNDKKMAAAFAVKHFAEYFCYVERLENKDSKQDLMKVGFVDATVKDFMDKAMKTGHRIRFQVTGNSIGPDGRTAEFTMDYQRGIINTYEEAFILGCQFGIIERPNNVSYVYKGEKYVGVKEMLIALRDNPAMEKEIVEAVYKLDSEKFLTASGD